MNERYFAVDRFADDEIGRCTCFSGWYMPKPNNDINIQMHLDGNPYSDLLRYYRHDVASKFLDNPLAVRSGFIGDFVVPEKIMDGEKFTVSLCAVTNNTIEILAERTVTFQNKLATELKVRNININHLLLSSPIENTDTLSIAGIPHFHPHGKLPIVRLSISGSTHPYSAFAQNIIDQTNGYVLDFGSGVQILERLRDHVINLDAVHFPYVDVVSTCKFLPFKSNVFDAIISQAAFEHLPDPFTSARELLRVLKPGGIAMIDTAFMQPFHGDPDHYFNMTISGLKQIMNGFNIIEIGIRPYQYPSFSLIMQIQSILPFVSSETWNTELSHFLEQLRRNGVKFDESLGEVGRELLAAGVYVIAAKPKLLF